MTNRDEQIIEGSGNVFADLGLDGADDLLVRAELTHVVHVALRDRRSPPVEAARLLAPPKADAARLIAGQFPDLSTERLLHLLTALDQDVEIVVRPRAAGRAQARLRVVSVAA